MSLQETARGYLEKLKAQWTQLHETPNVFAYKLNVSRRKYLPSERWHFYAEHNPERSKLRRLPQSITSLNPAFDEEKFNFKKIQPAELLMNIPYGGVDVSLIINNSPLTMYHTLICPEMAAGLGQRITLNSLSFSVALLRGLEDKAYRIGYNSPGALASLNHLHLHLMHIATELYIDRVKLAPLKKPHVYRLAADMPTEAICFVIPADDEETAVEQKVKKLYKFLNWLCTKNMPHNLFMTLEPKEQDLRVFVYARCKYCVVKSLSSCNIAFSELSGYVPLGNEKLFDACTEELVIAKIRAETGEAYKEIYKYFTKKISA